MYFDQALLAKVEAVKPYVTNRQWWTQNANDYLVMAGAQGDDPFMRYVMLGDSVNDGLFMWTRFGVDASARRTVVPAASLDASGGHQNMAGPVGDGSKVMAMPSGDFPIQGLNWKPPADAPNAFQKLPPLPAN